MRTKLHWPSVNAMVFGLGLCLAVSAITPTTSHAIPVAGDYAFTSGLTGTFTSDGTQLTNWNITDQFTNTWTPTTPGNFIFRNDSTAFDQGTPLARLIVFWDLNQADSFDLAISTIPRITAITYSPTTSVPEPSGLALVSLGLGLLMLVDYLRRQRRQAGLQIG